MASQWCNISAAVRGNESQALRVKNLCVMISQFG